jgi:ABC-type sugar transport system ATPase subunit
MNLVEVGDERPPRIGEIELELDGPGRAAIGESGGQLTVGFRPEVVQVGDGPLAARIRNVEDLGSEIFVHVAVEHRGDRVPLIAKMAPPFDGEPDDTVGLQIIGTTHVFGEDGSRIASSGATLRSPGAVSRS